MSPEQHMVIITTREAMTRQAHEAIDAITAANAGKEWLLGDGYNIDPAAFGRLIEALVALGIPVSDDMCQLARLRPVDEVMQ